MDAGRRMTLAVVGLVLVAAACGVGAWATSGETPRWDANWDSYLPAEPSAWLFAVGEAFDWLGGGWRAFAIPIVGVILLLIWRRWWSAAFVAVALLLSAGGVQLLKQWFGRARPDGMLVISDFGSFPSGHTANAATMAVVVFVLFPRLWVGIAAAAWVVLMALSRTVVHAHWLSDTFGGALVGIGTALLVFAAFAPKVVAERTSVRRPPADQPVGP